MKRDDVMTKYRTYNKEEGRQCPECGNYTSVVVATKYSKRFGQYVRQRTCKGCKTIWLTKEVVIRIGGRGVEDE